MIDFAIVLFIPLSIIWLFGYFHGYKKGKKLGHKKGPKKVKKLSPMEKYFYHTKNRNW